MTTVVIKEQDIDRAASIMRTYGSLLVGEPLFYNGQQYFVISKGSPAGIIKIYLEMGVDLQDEKHPNPIQL